MRLVNKAIDQLAGSGVGIDDDGRLCLPDGLDAGRVHRFIELCVDRRFDSPRSAMHDLFGRVGVAPAAVAVLEEVLDEHGGLDWRAVAQRPLKMSRLLPRLREIPDRFRSFLVEGLGLADPADRTLEQAVVSARIQAAARLGCEPCWDAILSRPDAVSALAGGWRARQAAGAV